MTITSLNNATVKLLASLRLEKYRTQNGLFLIEGERTVHEALKAGQIPRLLAIGPGAGPDIASVQKACLDQGGACITVTADVMRKIVQKDNAQSVVAAYAIQRTSFTQCVPKSDNVFVALDRIRDPGNLGTIIRTAHAVNAAGVFLIGACCDPYAVECVRATTGSIFHVPLYDGTEDEFLSLVQRWPGSVVGTAVTGAQFYRQIKYRSPVLAVMGTEQSGLSPVIQKACSEMAQIPMYSNAESLNVSVATAVLLYGIRETLVPAA